MNTVLVALSLLCVTEGVYQEADQERMKAGSEWSNEHDLVFTTRLGSPLDGCNVTRDFPANAESRGASGEAVP
jgi:hypothetical protein